MTRTEHLEPDDSTTARVDIWSTDAARSRDRFSYWRDAVCKAVFNITIEAAPEHFSARITARTSEPLRFAVSESTRYQIIRSPQDIARDPSEHFTIFLQLSEQTVAAFGEETMAIEANDIGIYDGREPFRAAHAGR